MAYILINVDLGTEKYILKEIEKIENVKEAHFVYGVYDIIAKVEADSIDKVKEIITMKIRRLENIKSTLTMMVMEIT
ncbi:MAG: Lrp/AsnC ligand binding domain-containing protein [Candidatus Methylarchaceae archaeon HK02M2]|nr:Lrp/AsnC ligand binding domain-containing protein [Candidatus Methylarchaceae archaeon HK02M2]